MGTHPSSASVEVTVHPRPDTTVRDRDFSLFDRWFPWLVPTFVVANIIVFVVTMYVNDCPYNSFQGTCVASFLGRFSFQPLKENPLFGPSSSTFVLLLSSLQNPFFFINHVSYIVMIRIMDSTYLIKDKIAILLVLLFLSELEFHLVAFVISTD